MNLNGMGPQNQGSMTGRGMGKCNGGIASRQGQGLGHGGGFCRWFGFSHRLTKAEEVANIKSYIENLKAKLSEAEEYLKGAEVK